MSIASDVEHAADTVVPQLRGARWAAYAILALLTAAAIGFVTWWVFVHPAAMSRRAAQSQADASLGKATGDIATSAIPQITQAGRQKVEVDVRVQKGMIDVRNAPDAGVAVGGVSDALRRDLCLHEDLYAADPDCVALHADPAGVGAAGADTGRAGGVGGR